MHKSVQLVLLFTIKYVSQSPIPCNFMWCITISHKLNYTLIYTPKYTVC
jgi:hypothetical protein